uniref:Uncharacterized protein n=1 Tax=Anguilla anguilla TaxID=7936 RepID=A0A0E9PEQ3_ANGAN
MLPDVLSSSIAFQSVFHQMCYTAHSH